MERMMIMMMILRLSDRRKLMDRFIREGWRGGRGLVLRRKKTKKKKMIMKRVKVSFPDSLKQKKLSKFWIFLSFTTFTKNSPS